MTVHDDTQTGTVLPPMNLPAAVNEIGGNDVQNMGDYVDYFGFEETHTYYLPDGKQWVQFKTMTEGDLARYQQAIQTDVRVERRTGDAHMKMDQSAMRQALILATVTGWNLVRRVQKGGEQMWQPVPFSGEKKGSELDKWMQKANPAIIADLHKQIQKKNPWLVANEDRGIEELDAEIQELTELRNAVIERERGELSSATK